MTAFERLTEIELQAWDIIGPVLLVFVTLAVGRLALRIVDDFVAGVMLRIRGYRPLMTVRINGTLATISKIGALSTYFQIVNGSDNRTEYLAVTNTRLDFQDVRRLVRKYRDDEAQEANHGC